MSMVCKILEFVKVQGGVKKGKMSKIDSIPLGDWVDCGDTSCPLVYSPEGPQPQPLFSPE